MGGSGSVAVQGLLALDDRPLSPRQRYAAILVALGEFIDGYDLIVMGGALILLRPQFGLSPSQVGLLGASTFLGAMVGMLIFGDMSDRWGRRAIFVANLIFFVVFSILSAFVHSRCRSCSSPASWWASASAWTCRPRPPTWRRSRRAAAAA